MTAISNLSILNQYTDYLLPKYNNFPQGHYVSLVVIRKTESETIFRTEGSGEGLVKETVIAGLNNSQRIRRVVISKRKQTAVERRSGREVLREHNFLKNDSKGQICALNTNAPCGKCIDCMLYGYAVGGNPITGKASTSINEDEYVLPETHFLDIETLKDVTAGELQYVIGNILRSSRYGAISSRLGKVRNTLVGIVFSDTELFSNLELTQAVYDTLLGDKDELDFPLYDHEVFQGVQEATDVLLQRLVSRTPVVVRGEILQQVLDETIALYRESESVKSFLGEIEKDYQ